MLTWTIYSWNSHLYLSFDTKPIFWWSGAPEIWWVLANWNIEASIRCFKWEVIEKATSTNSSSKKKSTSSEEVTSTPIKEDSIIPKFSFYF